MLSMTSHFYLNFQQIKLYRPFDTISDGDFSIDIVSSVSSFYVLFPGSKPVILAKKKKRLCQLRSAPPISAPQQSHHSVKPILTSNFQSLVHCREFFTFFLWNMYGTCLKGLVCVVISREKKKKKKVKKLEEIEENKKIKKKSRCTYLLNNDGLLLIIC
jgi:hypothetical protein